MYAVQCIRWLECPPVRTRVVGDACKCAHFRWKVIFRRMLLTWHVKCCTVYKVSFSHEGLTMPKMSPAELAAKWSSAFGASADRYKAGINRVTVNPAEQAIAAQDRMVANFNDAVNSGKWAAGLQRVTLSSWKQAATDKGASAIAAAARVGQAKVQAAEARIAPIRDAVVASLPPRGTIDQNLERARAMAMGMYNGVRRG